jgi:hypothetical protein
VSKVVSQLQLFVELQKDKQMSDAEFLEFLQLHPPLLTLLSAAKREGDVTPSIISANVASIITTKEKGLDAAIDINEQFRKLALWLIAAAHRFSFTVLGMVVSETAPKPSPSKNTEVDDHPPGFKKFVKKVGGIDQAKVIIQQIYDKTHSQIKSAEVLQDEHGFTVSQWLLSRLMHRLGLRINPRIGGLQKGSSKKKRPRRKKYARIKFQQGIKRADQALRKNSQIKMGIAKFLKKARADKKSLSMICGEILDLTSVKIGAGSISRLLKRLKIK